MTPQQYDAWYDTPRGRWIGDAEWKLLREFLVLQPGDTVLDVGCGTGWFTRRAAAEGAEVTGLDTDAPALAFARAHSSGAVRYVEGDACSLPFADRSFDAVMSVTALCFVADWPTALSEIVRVSRRRFAVGLLNQHSLLWLNKGRRGGQGAYAGAHWHTQREVDAALRRMGTPRFSFGYAVFLPSATGVARTIEHCVPTRIPLGSFMVTSGDSAH